MTSLVGDDDADLSLMISDLAEAWVVANPLFAFLSEEDLNGVHDDDDAAVPPRLESDATEMDVTNICEPSKIASNGLAKAKNFLEPKNNRSNYLEMEASVEATTIDKDVEKTLPKLGIVEDVGNEVALVSTKGLCESEGTKDETSSHSLGSKNVGELSPEITCDENPVESRNCETPADTVKNLLSPGFLSLDLEVVEIDGSRVGADSKAPLTSRRVSIRRSVKVGDLAAHLLFHCGRLPAKSSALPLSKIEIIVSHWRPIDLFAIAHNTSQEVGEIFGPLAEASYLVRVTVSGWPSKQLDGLEWNDQAVRAAVRSLLRHYTQKKLAFLCPLSQAYISMIANAGESSSKFVISESKCLEFGAWFDGFTQRVVDTASSTVESAWTSAKPIKTAAGSGPLCDLDARPVLIYHSLHELPLLRTWFKDHPFPSDSELSSFASRLNTGHWRSSGERPCVTLDKLRNWWKNERQRRKRLETKKQKIL